MVDDLSYVNGYMFQIDGFGKYYLSLIRGTGKEKLEAVRIQNKDTQEEKVLEVQGVFPLVGQNPNTTFIKLDIKNEYGNIPVDKSMSTSVAGCFAGGDVLPRDIRQIYLAEHDGMMAAKSIKEYLSK